MTIVFNLRNVLRINPFSFFKTICNHLLEARHVVFDLVWIRRVKKRIRRDLFPHCLDSLVHFTQKQFIFAGVEKLFQCQTACPDEIAVLEHRLHERARNYFRFVACPSQLVVPSHRVPDNW